MLTFDANARSNLVLPLRGHNFSVDARNINACVKTRFVMSLDNIPAEDLAGANTTVIWALWAGITSSCWPAVGPVIRPEEGIFLLKTEPDFVFGIRLHQAGSFMAVVEFVGCSIWIPRLAQNQDVFAQAERVGEHGDRSDVDIGVTAWCLTSRGAVKVPFGKFIDALDGFVDSLAKSSVSVTAFEDAEG
jgi:hypothetical protein